MAERLGRLAHFIVDLAILFLRLAHAIVRALGVVRGVLRVFLATPRLVERGRSVARASLTLRGFGASLSFVRRALRSFLALAHLLGELLLRLELFSEHLARDARVLLCASRVVSHSFAIILFRLAKLVRATLGVFGLTLLLLLATLRLLLLALLLVAPPLLVGLLALLLLLLLLPALLLFALTALLLLAAALLLFASALLLLTLTPLLLGALAALLFFTLSPPLLLRFATSLFFAPPPLLLRAPRRVFARTAEGDPRAGRQR